MQAIGPPRRFSTRFAHWARRQDLHPISQQAALHLRERWGACGRFLRTSGDGNTRAGEDQGGQGEGHQICPPLKPLSGVDAQGLPVQGLLGEAMAVFMRKPATIQRGDRGQRQRCFPPPDKPTDPGIPGGIACGVAGDPIQRKGDGEGFVEMDLMPCRDFDQASVRDSHGIGKGLRIRLVRLQHGTMETGTPWLAGVRGRFAVHLAMHAQADQVIGLELRRVEEEWCMAKLAIQHEADPTACLFHEDSINATTACRWVRELGMRHSSSGKTAADGYSGTTIAPSISKPG